MYSEWRGRLRHVRGLCEKRLLEEVEVRRLRAVTNPAFADVVAVIATYRRPETLGRAVRSALDQRSRRSIHVVVVDDGGGHLGDVRDTPDVTVISLRRNSGSAAVPRNVGIRLSDSRFVALLDDDNSWRPDHVEAAVDALESAPDAPFSYSRIRTSDGEVVGQTFDRRLLRRHNYIDANSMVLRRKRRTRFSTLPRYPHATYGVDASEDWAFAWRHTRRADPVFVDDVTVDYTRDGTSYYL